MDRPLQLPRKVAERENVWITLSDGCRLAARIWLPEDAESAPVPAILEYLPYRKRDATIERDEINHPYLAGHGYACIRVDMRGNGESDGLMEDEYTAQELADGVAVIDWIAAQPWCTGAVGMVGISWGGFNGLQIAALRPEPLKAIVTICSTDDRYADDIHYMGGCLLNDNLTWSSQMLGYSSRPPDPELVGERWREMWLHRLQNLPLLAANWLRHQRRDAFWKHASVCEDPSRIEAAVYAVGGWADAYTNAIPRLLASLEAPAKGLIGPWVHRYPNIATPAPAIGFLQEMLRWWDQWLKEVDTGIMDEPQLTAYLMDGVRPQADYEARPGRWIAEPSWPSPNVETRTFALNAGALGETPAEETPLTVASPLTTGLAGGRFCPGMRIGLEMPLDQREDDGGSLVFDSEVLGADLAVLGAPVVDLALAVDRPQAQVAVRLSDVHPDGAVTRISVGVLNLSHRDSHETPRPMPPGERVSVRVQLNDSGYVVPAGHRLRIAVSTAYWPLVWPAPEPVTMTVWTGASTLALPVRVDGAILDNPFERPIGAPGAEIEVLRPTAFSRRIERDIGRGEVVLRTVEDLGQDRIRAHGLEVGSHVTETFRIHEGDPLSAQAETAWTWTVGRGGWQTRTETRARMWCDREYFFLEARLEAYENDALVCEKDWSEAIPRDHM